MGVPSEKVRNSITAAQREVEYALFHVEDDDTVLQHYLRKAKKALRKAERVRDYRADFGRDDDA
jgi:hypothetical protein